MPHPHAREGDPSSNLLHGSSNATADAAVDAALRPEERSPFADPVRPGEPLARHEKPDQLAEKTADAEDRQEALLDEGVEESFPASDPPSVKRIT
jgi:hypothetical protein